MKAGLFSRIVAIVIAVLFIFPTVVVVGTSFTTGTVIRFPPDGFSLRWYEDIVSDKVWVSAFGNSVVVGLLAAAIAIVVGVLLALLAVRGNIVPASVVMGLAVTPMIVPTVVAGIGFYIVAVNIGLTGTIVGMALAHSAIGVPYVFITVLAALTSVDRSIEEAAMVSGAGEFTTFRTITLPLIAPSAIIGGLLAFVSSWDEVIIAGFLTSPQVKTLPIVMFSEVKVGAEPSTSAVATVVTLVTLLLLALVAGLTTASRRRRQSPRRS